MTLYHVHLYREMRLTFSGIEAATSEAAAALAAAKPTDESDGIEDCDGENLAALVDVAGDAEFSQTVAIEFTPELQRRAASKLLGALNACVSLLADYDGHPGEEGDVYRNAVAAITAAADAGIEPVVAGFDLHAALAERRQIADIWSILDVKEVRPDLTHDQAWAVLQEVRRHYDPAVGIHWDVLRMHARRKYGEAIAASGEGFDRELRPYSVLLLYPDYLDDTGYETYYAFVDATDALEAVACAQREAVGGLDIDDPTDFHPLLVMEGHHVSEPLWNR